MYIKPPSTAPYSIRQLRIDNPETSFPANPGDTLLAEWGVVPVVVRPIPEHDPQTHHAVLLEPVEIDGEWVQHWDVRSLSVEDMQSRQAADTGEATARNNATFESAFAALTADYPPSEIATWERQRAEALAWAADSSAPTPWIDIAASERGIPREDYLARTYPKAASFLAASAWLTGRRQRIDDAIRAAKTPEQLRAVVIDYTLPGSTA